LPSLILLQVDDDLLGMFVGRIADEIFDGTGEGVDITAEVWDAQNSRRDVLEEIPSHTTVPSEIFLLYNGTVRIAIVFPEVIWIWC